MGPDLTTMMSNRAFVAAHAVKQGYPGPSIVLRGDLCMDAAFMSNHVDINSSPTTSSPQLDIEKQNIDKLERAKANAEETAVRLLALQKMTAELSDATNPFAVAEIIVDHLAAMLPNARSLVALLSADNEYVEYIRDGSTGPRVLNRFEKLTLTSDAPIIDAIRTQTAVVVEGSEQIRQRYPRLPMTDSEQIGTVVAFPFVVDGRAIGGLAVRFSQPLFRRVEDCEFILHVARTCSQCLERAQLREVERLARIEVDAERRRLKLLAEVSAVLNASLDASAITDALTHVLVPNFADFCIIRRQEDNGSSSYHILHKDPDKEPLLRELVEPASFWFGHPIHNNIRSGKTVLLDNIDEQLFLPPISDEQREHLAALHKVNVHSTISTALIARGEFLGSFTVGTSNLRFQQSDVVFVEEIAQRTAMVLHNARLYHEAQEANREAQEANRVKDEFLGVVSHELRTPLNAILGWARMLRTGAVREGAQPRALEAIERNASHQARLIDDLLDASRITVGKLRLDATIVEFGQVVESAVQSVLPGATAKGIRLQSICETANVPVFADANRLQQIVWNLLSNAVKFTPQKGAIEVHVHRVEDEAVMRVIDNGRGIHADLIPHIFERFRQGDGTLTRNAGGLGLGLSIVRHLVEAHGGTIVAESLGPDKGSTFTVRLPISRPNTIPSTNPMPATVKGDTRKLVGLGILVIDDEPDAREILEEILTQAGATVKLAADAAEALRILSDFNPDLIISDLAMPGEDGLSLMRKIRARTPDRVASIPAIALTAYTRTEDRIQALNAGFQMHVPKPVDPKEIVATVASLRTCLVT